jgi:hypothetical protein
MGLLMLTPLALIIRAIRFGWRDAYLRLAANYVQLAPLEARDALRAVQEDHSLIPLLATIPEVELAELVPDPPSVTLTPRLPLRDGTMQIADLLPFLSLFAAKKPAVAFEIGTFFGTTTAMMALNSPGTVIHTLDLPPENVSGATRLVQDDFHLIRDRRLGEALQLVPRGQVIQHLGDSATWDYSPVREATFVLIDGAHTYEYIRSDTEKCLAACRRPATFVWHDCDLYHPGVVQWIAEMVAAGKPVRRLRGTALAVMTVN